ncbi:MAG: hypothetical protein QN172_06245 [Armatimonadota bacterium]|nr:hypothetical protein [Armatimonadota bacterium]MDR7439003.1 hypothetical protein [Armatimonadota bacterium]MDR7563257.1 hypothetical protein [Armatimonadota bacterium]MDR7566985.1 hypothetical protein [Armatimonadota bacterium]MDR7602044.1 hypothetical protein [Armatimonadota bacterium]
MSSEQEILARIRTIVREAVAERRGLVAYTQLGAAEMDRLARSTEREALERVAALVPEAAFRPELVQIRDALTEMQAALAEIETRTDIRESSRHLARDEVVWQTFERVLALLGFAEA